MSIAWCRQVEDGVRITVHVAPNARKTEPIGTVGDALKIRLQALPVQGKANDALVGYLADVLCLPRTSVTLVHGHTTRRKLVDVTASGLTPQGVAQRLWPGVC